MYRTTDGKTATAYLLGGKGEQQLINKGWRISLPTSCNETEQELYDRLIASGYKKVKIWKVATAVRRYHQIIAMVK